MIKMSRFTSVLFTVLVFTQAANAEQTAVNKHPCKEKKEAKHAARRAVHDCLDSWGKDKSGEDKDPTEDCTAKTQAFITAAKDLKACHLENHPKK